MADTFGVVAGSVWRSRSVRKLDRLAKLTYLYLHINPHRNSLGLYSLPIMFAADDMNESPQDVRDAITDITEQGLADYDTDESLLRVCNWELMNAPQGPQEAIGRVYKFDKAPRHSFTYAAFLSFMREVLLRAERNQWKDDFRAKLEELMFRRAEQWFMNYPSRFMRGFELAGIAPRDPIFDRLWESVSYKDNIPTEYPIETKTIDSDTEHRSLTQTQPLNKDTARANGPQPSSPASPAKKGSRATKAIPKDLKDDIAGLTERAGKKIP